MSPSKGEKNQYGEKMFTQLKLRKYLIKKENTTPPFEGKYRTYKFPNKYGALAVIDFINHQDDYGKFDEGDYSEIVVLKYDRGHSSKADYDYCEHYNIPFETTLGYFRTKSKNEHFQILRNIFNMPPQ